MGFLRWIIGFLIALSLTAFAVFNRTSVPLGWSPVHPPLEVPLYLIGLTMIAAGFILGGSIVWMNMEGLRREKRRQKKQIKTLEKELESVNKNTDGGAPSDFFPALPKGKK